MRIREAVSAVLIHENELFMIVRQPYLPVFPGYYAFPGGKVDRDEKESRIDHPLLSAFKPRWIHALAREMQEELGFDLFQACETGLVEAVSLLAEATTPPFEHYRFCNRFFRIDLTERPELVVDAQEAMRHGWYTPEALIHRWKKSELLAVPPVRTMISRLAENLGSLDVGDIDFKYDAEHEIAVLEVLPELYLLPVESNTLPPARHTNAIVVGDYVIDPSPADDAELERLITTLGRFPVKHVMLTHHHSDHWERVNLLARRMNYDIVMSEDTWQRLSGALPKDYFEGIEIQLKRDGDTLTTWGDQEVQVLAVPGHDEGQLAPMPKNRAWCLVGDLIQGIGTVVIAAQAGGNMSKYFASLERVIQLAPRVIIPSHGIAMGGTYRLEATLKHRRLRENQVKKLHESGKTRNEMLATIYPELDPRLKPLALANIEAHLDKLGLGEAS